MHAFKSKASFIRSIHKCCISVTWSVCLVGTYFNRPKAFIVIKCSDFGLSHCGWISLHWTAYVVVFSIQRVSLVIMCLKFNLDQVKSNHDVWMQNSILKQSLLFETIQQTKAPESNTIKEWNKVLHQLFRTQFIRPFAAVILKMEFVHHFWRVLSTMYEKHFNHMKISNTKSGTKWKHHREWVNRRKLCESCSMWETNKRERNFTKCISVLCLPFLCFHCILATLFDQYDKTIIWNVWSQTIYFLCCTISKLHAFIICLHN